MVVSHRFYCTSKYVRGVNIGPGNWQEQETQLAMWRSTGAQHLLRTYDACSCTRAFNTLTPCPETQHVQDCVPGVTAVQGMVKSSPWNIVFRKRQVLPNRVSPCWHAVACPGFG